MQPHSACAIALANYVFNHNPNVGKNASVGVEWTGRFGQHCLARYSVSDIEVLSDDYGRVFGLEATIKRSGDPLSCRITMETSASYIQSGCIVRMTHATQHRAGFSEILQWGKKRITGDHRNSLKYGGFSADFITEKQISVQGTLLKTSSNEKKYITFKIKIDSI